MATNISDNDHKASTINGVNFKIGIVVSQWNDKITNVLAQGAQETLLKAGVLPENILLNYVPGSFELPLGAQYQIKYAEVDAVICLGCVIQGETKHFDYVCQGAAQGILQVSLDSKTPVIFGVLTTNTVEQAYDRCGGKHGHKGVESAQTALEMLHLKQLLKSQEKK